MNHLEIEQSSITHPGHLTEDDVALLRSPGMSAIKLRQSAPDLTRRDAGSLLVVIEWLGGVVAGGMVGAFSKDTYEWVKTHAKSVMQKKIEDTHAAPSPYPARDPVWEIKIDMSDRERTFTITLRASSPEALERAAELFADRCARLPPPKKDAVWRFEQTLDDVEFHEVVADDDHERRP
jgi:hypothetical protein